MIDLSSVDLVRFLIKRRISDFRAVSRARPNFSQQGVTLVTFAFCFRSPLLSSSSHQDLGWTCCLSRGMTWRLPLEHQDLFPPASRLVLSRLDYASALICGRALTMRRPHLWSGIDYASPDRSSPFISISRSQHRAVPRRCWRGRSGQLVRYRIVSIRVRYR